MDWHSGHTDSYSHFEMSYCLFRSYSHSLILFSAKPCYFIHQKTIKAYKNNINSVCTLHYVYRSIPTISFKKRLCRRQTVHLESHYPNDSRKTVFWIWIRAFAKNYNLQQAKYFKENKGTVQERQNARHVYNAFNEYLEQTAKGGIIGGAFFVIFLVILIVQSYRYKNKVTLAVLLAIGTMSLTNYVQAALPVWILLLTVAALLASTGKSYSMNSMISKGLYVSVLIPFVFLSLMFNAQRQLKNSIDEHLSSPDRMEQYAVAAGSSEIYHRLYAKALIKAQEYEKALNVLCKAEKYTSSPSLFMLKATCLENLHRTKEAVENIETVYYMIPNDDDAKFELMLLYDALSQTDEMRSICNEILSLNKPESRKVNHYKNIADSLLKRRVP